MQKLRLYTAWILLLFCLISVASAQTPSPTPTPTQGNETSTSDTPGFDLTRPVFFLRGTEDGTRAVVRGPLSGGPLITVSSAEGFTAPERAQLVFERLQDQARTQGAQGSLVTSRVYDGVVVLMANELALATVMPEDTGIMNARALPPHELRNLQLGTAENWRAKLQRELNYAAYLKSPEYYYVAVPIILLVLLTAAGLHRFARKLRLRHSVVPLGSLEVLVWTMSVIFILWMFPQTKSLAWMIEDWFLWPFLKLYLLLVGATIFSHLAERLVRKYFDNLAAVPGTRPRRAQRLQTLSSVLCITIRAVMFVLVLGLALSLLPFNFMPLLTSAGIFGVALGLAGQDFLKDVIAGTFILMEDRFGVGDWIEWGTYSGAVESINLRATRIRTIQGGLITVSNSELRVVNNLSNEWAQVDFKIGVAYSADLDFALKILEEEAHKLAEDWSDKILEPPELKGVQELGNSSVVLRLYFKTVPLQQWDVQREFNRRMKLRLDQEGIEIPFPQTAVWMRQVNEAKG